MAKKRKSGTGTIHHRKDGRWEGRMVIGYDEKGLPKTKNVLAKTKTACAEKLKQLIEGQAPPEPKAQGSGQTFGSWLDFWYKNCSKPKLRPSTQHIYENWIYNHLIPELGQLPLAAVSTSVLQKFFTDMKDHGRLNYVEQHGEGLSNRTVEACRILCGKALDRAVEERLLPVNPTDGCKLAPCQGKEMRILTTEEICRFLIQAKEDGLYELFLLELGTGLRRGELLALRWEDLDFKTGELRVDKQAHPVHGRLTVSQPKTKAAVRSILLPPALLHVLEGYKRQVFSPWLFPSPRKPSQPIDPGTIRKRMHRILEKAQCKQIRFHDLRHTFATTALENGMDIKTLSTIIGHTSAATTLDIYTHVTDEMQRNAAISIDRGIAGVEAPQEPPSSDKEDVPPQDFTPKKAPRRRPGTGCVRQLNDHLWEGRYSPRLPDGTKYVRDVYAPTEEACEEKLAALILEMRAEIAELRAKAE